MSGQRNLWQPPSLLNHDRGGRVSVTQVWAGATDTYRMGGNFGVDGDGGGTDAALQIQQLLAALDDDGGVADRQPPPVSSPSPTTWPDPGPWTAPPLLGAVPEGLSSQPQSMFSPPAPAPHPAGVSQPASPYWGPADWRTSEFFGATRGSRPRTWKVAALAVAVLVAGAGTALLWPQGHVRVALRVGASSRAVPDTASGAVPATEPAVDGSSASPAPSSPVDSANDRPLVAAASVTASNLGAPWVLADIGPVDSTAGPNPCAPGLGPVPYTAGLVSQFDYGQLGNGGTGGYLFVTTLAAPSGDVASSRARGLASDSRAMACLGRADEEDWAAEKNAAVISASTAPTGLAAPYVIGGFRESATVRTPAGDQATLYIDEYWVVVGRLSAELKFQRCPCQGPTFTPDQQTSAIAAIVARLRAAQGI